MLGWLVLFSTLLGALFLYLVAGGGNVDDVGGWPVVAAVAFALMALYAVAAGGLRDGARLRRSAALSLVLTGLAAAAYYVLPKLDLAPMLSQLAQSAGTSPQPDTRSGSLRSVRIRINQNGQFLAYGEVDGAQTTFIIDTGASAVILRQSDAQKAGIDTTALAFTVPVSTANGEMTAAAVRLRSLSVGAIRMEGVEALIAAPGSLNESLLGMTFLRRLRSYEISGEFITLRE